MNNKMSLVDSLREGKTRVNEAFDALIHDVEENISVEPNDGLAVVKLTVTYSDGSVVDFSPSGSDAISEPDEVGSGQAGQTEQAGQSVATGTTQGS